MTKSNVEKLLDMCREGMLDPIDVLENVLVNYLSADQASEFAECEYDLPDGEDDEDDE